jgi:isopentenyldiphosphate isomerase
MNIVIVDATDNAIGLKEAGTLAYQDVYQVSALWLTDLQSGDILIAQRNWAKHNDPGKWSASVSGTVDEGETYAINITKEIQEEIGLTNLELTTGPKEYIDDGLHRYFVQWFFAKVDKDSTTITIQEEEVAGTKWITQADLIKDVGSNPDTYTPHFRESLKALGY